MEDAGTGIQNRLLRLNKFMKESAARACIFDVYWSHKQHDESCFLEEAKAPNNNWPTYLVNE